MNNCPICKAPGTEIRQASINRIFSCVRCGDFILIGSAADLPQMWDEVNRPDRPRRGRFAASHAIRRMQGASGRPPEIDEVQLRRLWAQPLPNPQRQAELFVLLLGFANLPLDQYLYESIQYFCAEIGTQDDPQSGITAGFNLVATHLRNKGYLESDSLSQGGKIGFRLTFGGWEAYERLRVNVVESKTAFMALGYGNANVDKVVADCFVPAVLETGFNLYRLDDRPKAGLIDHRMRVDIRAARFLICDLTDENRGAYWEAGFAEGMQKPVFYTCEKSKFAAKRSHFDTEHMFTILWDLDNLKDAGSQISAAIRNEFPIEAIPPDLDRNFA